MVKIISLAGNLSGNEQWGANLLRFLELPANPAVFITRPWTAVTYMFTQYDVFHILFNMLWLYWFGELFLTLGTERRLAILYLYGGLAGAALYGLTALISPLLTGGVLIGASGSVLAIVVATAMMMPDFKVSLLLIGPVSLKWIAIFTLIIDLAGMGGSNIGGHVAHIGGALAGAAYALGMRKGYDLTRPVSAFVGMAKNCLIKSDRSKMRSSRAADIENLDAILDKIKRSGYGSLTARERKTLFEISNRIK
ncbi:MAG: rhomboid family intramembrane serine protease [Paramuribaculum sp.]|nr:rhomboid family intramembrane serine protease [Paramuribaculum sp.]